MAKIDPKNEKYKDRGPSAAKCGLGLKTFVVLGHERYTSTKGKKMLATRFLCLEDHVPDGHDAKAIHFQDFCLEDNALFAFVNMVNAIGWSEPFDPDSDDDIDQIIQHNGGFFLGKIINRPFNGKDKFEVREFSARPEGAPVDPDWSEWIDEGIEGFNKYLEWRANNPRGQSTAGAGGGGYNRGGGGGGGSYGGGGSGDSDIPFSLAVAA